MSQFYLREVIEVEMPSINSRVTLRFRPGQSKVELRVDPYNSHSDTHLLDRVEIIKIAKNLLAAESFTRDPSESERALVESVK